MARHRKRTDLAFDALTIEGALITPAMMARIAARDAGEQKETDYGAPKGLTLRDEIAYRFRIGQGLFEELHAAAHPSHAATERFMRELLATVFRFDEVASTDHAGLHLALSGRVPVVVAPPADDLDKPSAVLSAEGRRRSAASTLQDYLNAEEAALWGLACNGERLRLMRDNASLTRPAYIEADLRRLFEAEAFADFTALWLLVHGSRFGRPGAAVTDCALERWREAGQKAGVAARDRLRDGFEAALLALGTGFLAEPSNEALRQRIESHALSLPDYFGQLLRLVYRLIFLFAAEDRGLLHPPGTTAEERKLYAEGYSASALRVASARRGAWDRHYDRWEGLRITFKALTRGEPKLGLPALDGLFARGSLPDLETARLSNRALMEAIWRLAWIKDGERPVPVNWRDMETEELGSVYEGLLELTPRLSADGRAMSFAEGAETKGNARKTSGSYYTPDSLVQLLLDSALDPVLDRVEAEAEDRAEALLKVTVIDPACGSGHFLLAAARRIATRVAKARAGGLASAEDYRHALRDAVRACIHGVDRNPMAVELAKVALWIETVDPGKPLGFLDANIRCGDALLGVFDLKVLDQGIPDAAYKPLSGDDKDAARIAGKVNRQQKEQSKQGDLLARLSAEGLARETRRVLALPEDDVAALQQKAEAWRRLRAEAGWGARKLACDLYVAAFLRKKAFRTDGLARAQTPDRVPTTLDVRTALSGGQPDPQTTAIAVDLAGEARAFNWPLEFPVEMAAGGFDVVLGNPPWERIKLQEQEFFAAHAPEIANAPNSAARSRMIAALAAEEPSSRERALYEAFERAKRTAEASSAFARVPGEEGGRFPLTGRGDVNTYALFAELFSSLTSTRGCSGVIVPTGIATDATTALFFGHLISSKQLASFLSFENEAMIFPNVHHAFKFSLMTLSGKQTSAPSFVFYARETVHVSDERRQFRLSAEELSRINPNTQTAPVFRSKRDAELTTKIYSKVPVLIDEDDSASNGNPWGLSFMAMFHMANDSGIFRTSDQLADAGLTRSITTWNGAEEGKSSSECWLPLYEAKMVHQFDHRWATYDNEDTRDSKLEEKWDSHFETTPRYWVPEAAVDDRLSKTSWGRGWLMGWRDIARATDERTVIMTVLPRAAMNHKIPLIFSHEVAPKLAALQACLSSLVLDFVARQKVGGTSLTYFYIKQFAVIPPSLFSDADLAFIVPRVLELTYTSWSLQAFARDLGHEGPPFAWDEDRRTVLRAELDAWYARAYGLTRDELRYILDPADVMGPDYPSETFRVLKEKEERRFGEYRTRRLVLAAWDAQEAVQLIPSEVPAPSPLVHPSGRGAGDWARTAATDPVALRLQTQAQIAAVLKSLRGPTPARQVRLAALYALEPHLLSARLDSRERGQWVRAVGGEANPPAPGVVSFGLGGATGWGEALRQLRAAGALVDDPSTDTWAPGSGLSQYFTEGWPERAGFALAVAGKVLADQALTLTSDESNGVAALAA